MESVWESLGTGNFVYRGVACFALPTTAGYIWRGDLVHYNCRGERLTSAESVKAAVDTRVAGEHIQEAL